MSLTPCINPADLSYTEVRWPKETYVRVAQRPAGYVLAAAWQSDPMNAAVCWRPKTAQEIAAEKTVTANIEYQFSEPLKAFAKVLLDEINILRSAAGLPPRSLSQLKTAIENKLP